MSHLELADIAWSGFAEFARQWLLLSRREPYIDGTGEHRLYLRSGGSAGHSALIHLDASEGIQPNRHWQIDAKSYGEVVAVAQERQYLADVEKVQAALRNAGEPLVKDRLYRAAGIGYARFNSMCQRMVDDGAIKVIEGRHIHYTLGENQNG